MDEPESTAGLTMAVRENLDNIIYVVNCNLQRSTAQFEVTVKSFSRRIISGWMNVIKVIWSHHYDALLQKILRFVVKTLTEILDGALQASYVSSRISRKFLSGENPDLSIISTLSDKKLNLVVVV